MTTVKSAFQQLASRYLQIDTKDDKAANTPETGNIGKSDWRASPIEGVTTKMG